LIALDGEALPAIAAAIAATAATTTTTTAAAAATAATAAATATTAAATATTTAATATAAAAAKSATTAAAARAATATATAATLTLLRLVDAQGPAVEERAVHLGDRFRGLGVVTHGDERKTARFAGLAIRSDVDVAHFAERSESSTDRIRCRVKRQITYVETITHVCARFVRGSEKKKNPPSNQPSDRGGDAGVPRSRVVATSRDT
jgi:hypothetical protein